MVCICALCYCTLQSNCAPRVKHCWKCRCCVLKSGLLFYVCSMCCCSYASVKNLFSYWIFSELRLERSKHGNKATRHAGAGIAFDTRSYRSMQGSRKSLPKIHCNTMHNVFATSSIKERLKYLPFYWPCLWTQTMLQQLPNLTSDVI